MTKWFGLPPAEIVLTIVVTALATNVFIHRDRWESWSEEPAPTAPETTVPEVQASPEPTSASRDSIVIAGLRRARDLTDPVATPAAEAIGAGSVTDRKTLNELRDIAKNSTSIQAERRLAPYLHRKRVVAGTVYNVSESSFGLRVNIDTADECSVNLGFPTDYDRAEEVRALDKGDRIAAVGTLAEVSSLSVSLENAELVDADDAPR